MATISPYDRGSRGERKGFIAFLASVLLHIAALAVFLFLSEMSSLRLPPDNVIYVQLGSDIPQAAAAPKDLPVDPNQTGPDVREAPTTTAPQPPSRPVESVDRPISAPPADDVIPLKPRDKDKPPEIKKTDKKPPEVTPPTLKPTEEELEKARKQREKERQDRIKAQKALEDKKLKEAMEEIRRKKEADALAAENPNATQVNTNIASGSGDGAGSDPSGLTRGERVHPEVQAYYDHIRDIVKYNWIPSDDGSEDIAARYTVTIEPSGNLSASRLARSSGSASFDMSVERAVKASVFPALYPIFNNQAHTVTLEFTPKGLRQQ